MYNGLLQSGMFPELLVCNPDLAGSAKLFCLFANLLGEEATRVFQTLSKLAVGAKALLAFSEPQVGLSSLA